MRISHETIYETLFVQARGECRTQLRLALRSGRVRRLPRGASRPQQARITGVVNISERPAEAEDRAVPGHWESDLIIGAKGRSQILTLVERSTRFVILHPLLIGSSAEQANQHAENGEDSANYGHPSGYSLLPFGDHNQPFRRYAALATTGKPMPTASLPYNCI